MKVAIVGAELEENLGIRYMASSLESRGHVVEIVPFNSECDILDVVRKVILLTPTIVGLSMVFTGRGREFCNLAGALRDGGFRGHLTAGGPFASFNCEALLRDFSSFDSIALGEGETLFLHPGRSSRRPIPCSRPLLQEIRWICDYEPPKKVNKTIWICFLFPSAPLSMSTLANPLLAFLPAGAAGGTAPFAALMPGMTA